MQRTVIRRAERRRGLVTRADLVAAGVSPGRVRHWQRADRLRSLRPRVFTFVGCPPSWEQGLHAVLLAVPGAVASHGSALRLLGVRAPEEPYEITTVRSRRVRLPGVRAHRSTCWLPEDVASRRGMPCASAARTVVDVSGRFSADELGRIVDDLVRRRLLRMNDLIRTAGRLTPARGRRTERVRAVLVARREGFEPGDTALEAKALRALAAAGVPAPTAQHRVRVRGRTYRIDLAYPADRIAIEIDSWQYHRWRSSFDGDRARRNDLTILGYRVIQVTDGMPDAAIVATVSRALEALGRPCAS